MNKYLVQLHLLIIVLAFTGLLGDLISVDAFQLVWYRTFFGAAGLLIYLILIRKSIQLKAKNLWVYLGIGITIGLHWFCFFHSIQISTISVGVGCLASTTLFTSILDPLICRKKIHLHEVFISILIIIGLYTIFQFETSYTEGILYAAASAFFAALFTVLNKQYVDESDHKTVITFYEILGACATLSIIQAFRGEYEMYQFALSADDWIYLLILGLVCTSWAFLINIKLLARLSAFVIVLSYNLEPIYGILIGALMGEAMTNGFYIGATIILASVFIYPILHKRLNKLS